MKILKLSLALFITFLTITSPFSVKKSYAQKDVKAKITELNEAISYLRELNYDRAFEVGVMAGEALTKKFPNSVQLKAWYVDNLLGDDQGDKALKIADQLVEKYPENAWSYFALAQALDSSEDSVRAKNIAEKALSMKKRNVDFLTMWAADLPDKKSFAFIDSVKGSVNKPVPLMSLKAHTLIQLSREKEQEKKKNKIFKEALSVFEKVRMADPGFLDGWYLPAYYLRVEGEEQKAFELYKKAISLSTALRVHNEYWRMVMGRDQLKAEEKKSIIVSDIQWLHKHRPISPKMLGYIARTYEELGMKKEEKFYEDLILAEFPKDVAAEWVLVGRYRDFEDKYGKEMHEGQNDSLISEYREMLWNFINRPVHIRETLIGDAYRSLYYTYLSDSTISADTLLQVVNGMVKYEGINPHTTHAGGAILLANRGIYFDRAKKIVREGIKLARKKINEQKIHGSYDTEKEYQKAIGWYTGIQYDALGWVFFKEGKKDSAKKYLLHAYSLNNDNPDNLYHLGKFFEAQGKYEKAEKYYTEGFSDKVNGEYLSKAALKKLFVTRNGSEEGFEEYIANLQNGLKAERKQKILNARLENPKPLPAFTLANLKGEKVSSKELKDKILVINIWGIWCGPCVREMPDIQKLHEKYKDNEQVKIVTINNDTSIQKVKRWMKERNYTFSVLRDNGYLAEEGVHLFPTTWFVNMNSKIAFIKEGYTKKLVQEYSWRIEKMLERVNE